MPYLAGIAIYPFKSFDPVAVAQTRIVENGGLEHDREFALFDEAGKYVNSKRTPRIALLQASVEWKDGTVRLLRRDTQEALLFHLHRERAALEAWLSDYFALPITVRQNTRGGFPDDPQAPGPTLIGQDTLAEVCSWYPDVTLREIHIRFRANLEIADAPAFWEDHLFGEAGEVVRFQIGDVVLEGTNPCQRCIVPTRDSRTGTQSAEFAQTFRARREETLPPWANRSRFNHFYRLAVNTSVPASEVGKSLRLGDNVRLL